MDKDKEQGTTSSDNKTSLLNSRHFKAVVEWAKSLTVIVGALALIFGIVWGAMAFVRSQTKETVGTEIKTLSAQMESMSAQMKSMEDRMSVQMKSTEERLSSETLAVQKDTTYLRSRLDGHIDGQAAK